MAHPPTGTSFGPYVLESPLGEGPLARVYRATATGGRLCALKVLRTEFGGTEVADQFVTAASATQRILHPHLIEVLDQGEHAGVPYVAMELARGTLLERVRESGPLAPADAVEALLPAAEALAEMHAWGLVHHNVGAHNLMIDAEGQVKLADAGVPVTGEELATLPAASMAARLYASPEQLRSPGSVDARADVFGLGATLWTLVTGNIPRGPLGLLGRPPSLDAVPEALQFFIARCCHGDAAQRYANATEATRELLRLRGELGPASATPLGGEMVPVGLSAHMVSEVAASEEGAHPTSLPPPRLSRASLISEGAASAEGRYREAEPEEHPLRQAALVAALGGAVFFLILVGSLAIGTWTMHARQNATLAAREVFYAKLDRPDVWGSDPGLMRAYEDWRGSQLEPSRVGRALRLVEASRGVTFQRREEGEMRARVRGRALAEAQKASLAYLNAERTWRAEARTLLGRFAISMGLASPAPAAPSEATPD